jgi:hypothetical protein
MDKRLPEDIADEIIDNIRTSVRHIVEALHTWDRMMLDGSRGRLKDLWTLSDLLYDAGCADLEAFRQQLNAVIRVMEG